MIHRLMLSLAAVTALAAQTPGPISPRQLKGDLSFLSSDALAGRYTPSPTLNIAAEFIASRFRAIGLQPLPDGTYFQNAKMLDRTLPQPSTALTFKSNGEAVTIAAKDYVFRDLTAAPVDLADTPVVILSNPDPNTVQQTDLTGKVLLVTNPRPGLLSAIQKAHPALAVSVTSQPPPGSQPVLSEADHPERAAFPRLSINSEALLTRLNSAPSAQWTFSGDLPAAEEHAVTLHNVAAILPGSDPALKRQVVMVTAHFDHIGTGDTGRLFAMSAPTSTDSIYNGADDDGSGTVSVIAIAQSLARVAPKRTILFVAFFGEERGLIGSAYYAHHPLFPLADTIADINLEQLGRIDDVRNGTVTPRPKTLMPTGYGFTDLPSIIQKAGLPFGVTVYNSKDQTDPFFLGSDNAALSRAGVPSTTVCAAFEFPDYHGVGDEWQKIDYLNMARVDRVLARAVLQIANSQAVPHWNANNPKTAEYVSQFKTLHSPH